MKTFPWKTVGGHDYYEVASALQKCVRRGQEEDALFWGTELYLSEYADHAWSRLLIIASEDVGLASPQTFVQVKGLHDLYTRNKKSGEAKLFFVHAVLALVRAPKSRIVDHATIAFFEGVRPHRNIPDYAYDLHTSHGRLLKRGYEHFFDEGSLLVQPDTDLVDRYRERARRIRCEASNKPVTAEELFS
jgi:replication-associated recombination protein RarA